MGRWAGMKANLIAEGLSSTGWENGQRVRTSEDPSNGACLLVTKRFVSEGLCQQLPGNAHPTLFIGNVVGEAREGIGVGNDSLPLTKDYSIAAMGPLFLRLVTGIGNLGVVLALSLRRGSWRLATGREQLVPGIEVAHFRGATMTEVPEVAEAVVRCGRKMPERTFATKTQGPKVPKHVVVCKHEDKVGLASTKTKTQVFAESRIQILQQ